MTIVHRRGEARACRCLMEKAINEPRIRFQYNTEVTEILGRQEGERGQAQGPEDG